MESDLPVLWQALQSQVAQVSEKPAKKKRKTHQQDESVNPGLLMTPEAKALVLYRLAQIAYNNSSNTHNKNPLPKFPKLPLEIVRTSIK